MRLNLLVGGAWFLMAGVLLSCSDNPQVAGDVLEAGNAVSGIVQGSDSTLVPGATVKLIPVDYTPVPGENQQEIRDTLTNDEGRYQFNKVPAGMYNVIALSSDNMNKAMIPGIDVTEDQDLAVTEGMLDPVREVTVTLRDSMMVQNGYIYLTGTDVAAQTGASQSTITIGGIPRGVFTELVYEQGTTRQNLLTYDTLFFNEARELHLYPQWVPLSETSYKSDLSYRQAAALYAGVDFIYQGGTPLTVTWRAPEVVYAGNLYFVVPGSDSAHFLFSNLNSPAGTIDLSSLFTLAQGDTIRFRYDLLPDTTQNFTENDTLPKYTGPNTDPTSPYYTVKEGDYGHVWSMAGRVDESTVECGFEDIGFDYDFTDVIFHITGVNMVNGLRPEALP